MLRLSRPLSWLKYRTKGFPKLLKLVTAYLCKRDVRMIFYLDEFLFLSSSYREVWIRSARAVTLRQNVGFTVNREKSCLTPIQMLTFLGFPIRLHSGNTQSPRRESFEREVFVQ